MPTETLLNGLQISTPGTLSFAPTLRTRSFVLERERGNLGIYGSPALPPGDVARVYVNHWHEVAVGEMGEPAGPLFVHAADRERVERNQHVRAAFSTRHMLDDDFEAIPTPGHTPGATAFLWDSGASAQLAQRDSLTAREHRFLFTGDSLYLRDGEWVAALLDSSDRPSYTESLELIRELDFDVLVPWAATVDQPYFALTDREDTHRRIDAILDRFARGEDH